MGFLSQSEIHRLGFRYVGKNVLISDKCSIYKPENISIGDHSRIDDFVVLSAGGIIHIGAYVHISVHCSLIGAELIYLSDFSGLSSHVSVFASSDPYDGSFMTNPTIPEKLRATYHNTVHIGKHSVVGSHSTILPGAYILDNVAIGAMSLCLGTCTGQKVYQSDSIYAGTPAKFLRDRKSNVYELEKQFYEQ